MSTIAFISCTKSKRHTLCAARDMYSPSRYFRTLCDYARFVSEKQYVLSAKHGLLEMSRLIEPYNDTLKHAKKQRCVQWADMVDAQLKSRGVLRGVDTVVWLAGERYRLVLIERHPELKHVIPGEGLCLTRRYRHILAQLEDLRGNAQ